MDLHVLTLVERAVFYIYGSKLQVADNELNKAMELTSKCVNYNMLLGRCYTYKAYIYLYKAEYQKSLDNLGIARQLMALYVSGEEKAQMCYLYGCIYMKLAGGTDSPSDNYEAKSLEFFKLDNCHVQEDPDDEVRMKRLQYGIFKQATVYLRTYTQIGYDFPVEEHEISKAKELLDYFELHLWDQASAAAKIHFASLTADYFFRINCFQRSMEILEHSLKDAEKIGHTPMINMVKDRINLFRSRINQVESLINPDSE